MIHNKKGFTLIELLVTISIMTMVATLATNFIVMGMKYNTYGYEQDSAVQTARRVFNGVAKEIREANQGDDGSFLLETTNDYEFTFYSNIDDDLSVERIRYFLDGTVFKKGIIQATGTVVTYPPGNEVITEVADNIENINQSLPIFTYYNGDMATTSNKASIRLIRAHLNVNVTPERAPNDYNVIMDIQVRNLKDNL